MFERLMQGAVELIRGDEPINAEHVEELAALLREIAGRGQPFVVLDLEKVPLLDSAGLELLLDYRDSFQQLGGALKLAGPNPLCEDILSITGVGAGFEVFRESLAAVGSFVR
jgi:anti-anti-sigma factor